MNDDEDAGNAREFNACYTEYSVNEHNSHIDRMHEIKYNNFGGNTAIEIWMHMFNP